jgi:hypothetical protein
MEAAEPQKQPWWKWMQPSTQKVTFTAFIGWVAYWAWLRMWRYTMCEANVIGFHMAQFIVTTFMPHTSQCMAMIAEERVHFLLVIQSLFSFVMILCATGAEPKKQQAEDPPQSSSPEDISEAIVEDVDRILRRASRRRGSVAAAKP